MWRYGYYSWWGGDASLRCHPMHDLLREAAYMHISVKLGTAGLKSKCGDVIFHRDFSRITALKDMA